MNTASARARRWAGTRSPISELAVGAQVASPTPTPRRRTTSDQKLHANPEASVSTLQSPTADADWSSHARPQPPGRVALRHSQFQSAGAGDECDERSGFRITVGANTAHAPSLMPANG